MNDLLAHSTHLEGAIALVNYEKELIWHRYNTMLLVNSIIVGVLSSVLSSDVAIRPLIGIWLSLGGIFLSVLWFHLNKQGWRYFRIYEKCAADLWERSSVANEINPFTLEPIDISPSLPGRHAPMQWASIRTIATLIVFVFISAYFVIFIVSFELTDLAPRFALAMVAIMASAVFTTVDGKTREV